MYVRWLLLIFLASFLWKSSLGEVTCEYIDKCTCEMSDGSGQVNLHSLAALDTNEEAFTVADAGWIYRYNPCYGFEPYWFYCFRSEGLSIAQTNSDNSYGYDLGTHKSMYFNLTEASGLSIHYKACDKERQSRVLLICDSGTRQHKFEFIGELVVLEYDFFLTSPCACPGGCDDNGIINPPPTNPPTNGGDSGGGVAGGGGGVNFPENIEINVNQNTNDGGRDKDSSSFLWTDVGGAMIALIFHDLLLLIVVAAVVIIVKFIACGNCNDDTQTSEFSFSNGINLAKDVFNLN